jgi:hypothetical protein
MFDALADQLYSSDCKGQWQLPHVRHCYSGFARELIARDILDGPLQPLQAGMMDIEKSDLTRPGGWGCHAVLVAAASIYQRNIEVYGSRDAEGSPPLVIEPLTQPGRTAAAQQPPLRLCHWFESHFSSLERVGVAAAASGAAPAAP